MRKMFFAIAIITAIVLATQVSARVLIIGAEPDSSMPVTDTEGASRMFYIRAIEDVDQITLVTWSVDGAEVQMDEFPPSGESTYTAVAVAGTHTVRALATNSSGETAWIEWTWVVTALPHHAPALSPIGDKVVNESESLTFTVTATDADNDTITYHNVTPLPLGATLNETSGLFEWTPTYDQAGTYSVTFTASDGDPETVDPTQTIQITVNNVNRAPMAQDDSIVTAANTPAAITLVASDPDGNPLVYTIVSGPSHGTLSGTAPALTYTPSAGYSGVDSFTFKVNDGLADSNIATVSISVNPPPPPSNTGEIRGMVFVDLNKDGEIQALQEAAVAGLTVRMKNAAGLVSETVTDINGGYSFAGLTPGKYAVSLRGRVGGKLTTPRRYVIVLASGETAQRDFGISPKHRVKLEDQSVLEVDD